MVILLNTYIQIFNELKSQQLDILYIILLTSGSLHNCIHVFYLIYYSIAVIKRYDENDKYVLFRSTKNDLLLLPTIMLLFDYKK